MHQEYTGTLDQSSLKDLIDQAIQNGTLDIGTLAPKSIETVIDQAVKTVCSHVGMIHPFPVHVEIPYSLSAAAIIYMTMRFQEVFGPTTTITAYEHPQDKHHVVFQFKVPAVQHTGR